MSINQEYIRQLITEKLTGTISMDDNLYLEQCIQSDKQAALLWKEMQYKWKVLQGDSMVLHANPEHELEGVKRVIHSPARSIPVIIKQLVAAAALVIIVLGIWSINQKQHPVVSTGTLPKVIASKKIELVLGSGKTLSISGKPQTIDLDQIKLNASSGILKYSGSSQAPQQFNTLNIPEKLDYKIALSDGTIVWLNSSSSLKFPFAFSGEAREVYLNGEAYFEVAKDPKHPFLVHTPKTTIQVLGTSFNVNTYDPGIITTSLVEGRVKTIAVDGDSMLLRPGFEAQYNGIHQRFQKRSFDKQFVLSWMEGSYLFDKVPLQDLTGPLERWFGIRVIADNKEVTGKIIVSGIIEKGKLQEFLENLQASTGIKYSLANNHLRFTSN